VTGSGRAAGGPQATDSGRLGHDLLQATATHDDDNEIQFTVLVQKIPSPPSTIEGGDGSQEQQGHHLAAPANRTTLCVGSCSECFLDQRACLPQLGSSSIMIGTQFDKAFLDPSLVFRGGLRNLSI
jgi:hypothetical protein